MHCGCFILFILCMEYCMHFVLSQSSRLFPLLLYDHSMFSVEYAFFFVPIFFSCLWNGNIQFH